MASFHFPLRVDDDLSMTVWVSAPSSKGGRAFIKYGVGSKRNTITAAFSGSQSDAAELVRNHTHFAALCDTLRQQVSDAVTPDSSSSAAQSAEVRHSVRLETSAPPAKLPPTSRLRIQATGVRQGSSTAVGPPTAVEADVGEPPNVGGSPAEACGTCGQPPDTDVRYWTQDVPVDALSSCPSCPACRMPKVPRSMAAAVDTAVELFGGLDVSGYDRRREKSTSRRGPTPQWAPRPREHAALFQGTVESDEMLMLLDNVQRPRCSELVDAADAGEVSDSPARVLQVRCQEAGCQHPLTNFDYWWGHCIWMKRGVDKGQDYSEKHYVDSPSIQSFLKRTIPAAKAELRRAASGKGASLLPVPWSRCVNCETRLLFEAEAKTARDRAVAASDGLGLRVELNAAVDLDVALELEPEELPTVQLKGGGSVALGNLLGKEQRRCAVVLVRRERVAHLLDASLGNEQSTQLELLKKLKGVVDFEGLFGKGLDIGDTASNRRAAGGDANINTALVLLAPSSSIDDVLAQPPQRRAASLRVQLRPAASTTEREPAQAIEALGCCIMLPASHSLPPAAAVRKEQQEFLSRKHAGSLTKPQASTGDAWRNNKSDTQRTGLVNSYAAMVQCPDFVRYGRVAAYPYGGEAYKWHTALVLRPDGDRKRALLLYPAGPDGKPRPHLRRPALDDGGKGKRASYGQPRTMEVIPGRPFLDLSEGESRELQACGADSEGGPYRRRSHLFAEAGLLSFGILAALGLVPGPSDVARTSAQPAGLLGEGLAKSAEFTWEVCRSHSSLLLAIAALAAVQGVYENAYRGGYHFDTDPHGETFGTLRDGDEGPPVAPTRVPQLGVNLCTECNRTLWTVALQRALHGTGAGAGAALPRPEGWRASRSAGEIFAIQARGKKFELPLGKV